MDFEKLLPRIRKSKFRSRFKLDRGDLAYIERVGWETIELHAADFLRKRLAPAQPRNDGKQTPFKGHPVFKAQHATATCCRGCLAKWHQVPRGRELTDAECRSILRLLLAWIRWGSHST